MKTEDLGTWHGSSSWLNNNIREISRWVWSTTNIPLELPRWKIHASVYSMPAYCYHTVREHYNSTVHVAAIRQKACFGVQKPGCFSKHFEPTWKKIQSKKNFQRLIYRPGEQVEKNTHTHYRKKKKKKWAGTEGKYREKQSAPCSLRTLHISFFNRKLLLEYNLHKIHTTAGKQWRGGGGGDELPGSSLANCLKKKK